MTIIDCVSILHNDTCNLLTERVYAGFDVIILLVIVAHTFYLLGKLDNYLIKKLEGKR